MKILIRFCALVIVYAMCNGALAQVQTSANVNLRRGPGVDYTAIFTAIPGEVLNYLDESVADDRGIDWHHVEYGGVDCWVSSKYAKIIGGDAQENMVPLQQMHVQPGVGLEELMLYDPAAGETYIELSAYFRLPLEGNEALPGLDADEVSFGGAAAQNSPKVLFTAAGGKIEAIHLSGVGYKLFGAAIGMHDEAACALMRAAGLVFQSSDGQSILFAHPAPEGNAGGSDVYDFHVRMHFEEEALVEIELSGSEV